MDKDAAANDWSEDSSKGPDWISLIVVNAAVDALSLHRVPVSLELARLRERFRETPQALVPRRFFLDLLERACAAHGDPGLGLTLGESLTEMSFHFVGPLVTAQPTLRDTMNTFVRLARVVLHGPRWYVMRDGDDVVVGYTFEPTLGPGARPEAELCVTALQRNLLHWLGAYGRNAVTAQFGYEPPAYLDRYRSLFGMQLRFREPITGVRFPAALLELQRPGMCHQLAREFAELEGRWLPHQEESWAVRVKKELASCENLSTLTFDDLAWRWGLSARSLRRRLAGENTSFTTLLEQARIARAKELLAHDEYSLTQIAQRLGYWEVNSFQRAFKRWNGSTPGSYRHQAMRSRGAAE